MLKLICGLFVVVLSVNGTIAFGNELSPMNKLPTFHQMMSLTPTDRRAYLEQIQNVLVAMAGQSAQSKSDMVASNEPRITIARYNMIIALLQTLDTNAYAGPGSGIPVEDVTEKVGDVDFLGRTCEASSRGICTEWTGWWTTKKDNMMRKVDTMTNTTMADRFVTKVDATMKGTTQQTIDDKSCTSRAQKAALSTNKPLLPSRVYAGHFLGFDTQRPASSFCTDSKVDMTKNPEKCPTNEKVACKGSDQVLCNPLVFSTVSVAEGICVDRGGSATADCAKAAAAKKPGYDFLANAQGPITEAWQKFAKDFNSLCVYSKGQQGNPEGKAMAQCSECAIMSKGMKSINTKYKDKLFLASSDQVNDKMGITPNAGAVKSSPIPSGEGTVAH